MATTKAAKKSKPKAKVVKKSGKRPQVARAPQPAPSGQLPAPQVVTNETFSVNAQASTLPAGTAALFVNGTSKGNVDVKGRKLLEFVTQQAQNHGLKNFSVYVDNSKVTMAVAQAPLDDPQRPVSKIELVAKDDRALDPAEDEQQPAEEQEEVAEEPEKEEEEELPPAA